MPEGGTVNVVELSTQAPGRAFIAVYRYREDDFNPYIFRTNDYGKKWDLLTDGTNGIPSTHFTRAIREDPDRKGLLYAGTEFGLYLSVDDGAHWQRFQLNLPVTPVTDLRVHRKDLVVSTQGRSFWVLDNVTPLHQITEEVESADMWLYAPRTAYRGGSLSGATIDYYFKDVPEEELTLEVLDSSDNFIQTFKGKADDEEPSNEGGFFARLFGGKKTRLPVKKGLNRFNWSLREEGPEIPKGVVHWGGTPGMQVVPGTFQVRLSAAEWTETRPLEVRLSPNVSTTVAELEEQHKLATEVAAAIESLFGTLGDLRDVKAQSKDIVARMKKAGEENEEIADAAKALDEKLTEIEEQITQVKSKSGQDPINFPPMIDNQLTTLYSYVVMADYPPTAGAYERFDDLRPDLASLKAQFDEVVAGDLMAFNQLVSGLNLPPVILAGTPATEDR